MGAFFYFNSNSFEQLMEFIENLGSEDKAIVFVGRKIVADQISSDLGLANVSCQCIHGDRDQLDREQVSVPNVDVNS